MIEGPLYINASLPPTPGGQVSQLLQHCPTYIADYNIPTHTRLWHHLGSQTRQHRQYLWAYLLAQHLHTCPLIPTYLPTHTHLPAHSHLPTCPLNIHIRTCHPTPTYLPIPTYLPNHTHTHLPAHFTPTYVPAILCEVHLPHAFLGLLLSG